MRQASLILPTTDNDGVDQSDSHRAMQLVLIDYFGGFTMTNATGAWRDDSGMVHHDDSQLYSIAMHDTSDMRAKLECVARFYGHMMGQDCVMLTHAAGDVAFIYPDSRNLIADDSDVATVREPSHVELHAWA